MSYNANDFDGGENKAKERLWTLAIGIFVALCGSVFSYYLGKTDKEKAIAGNPSSPRGVLHDTLIVQQQVPSSPLQQSPVDHFFSFSDSFMHGFFGVLVVVLVIALILILMQIWEWIDIFS